MAVPAKGLFLATRPKGDAGQGMLGNFPRETAPAVRDPLDFDPTPEDATAAFLAVEQEHIRAHGSTVWEPAVGAGHMARVLIAHGFEVIASDVVDRGWPGVELRSFFDYTAAPAAVHVTNPPYNEINARDGHGRWLLHAMTLQADYVALLLNTDWAAARINGFDRIFREHPPSIEYVCCWKIDFRGGGAPPQRNSWFVWDSKRPAFGPDDWRRRRLYRDPPDARQGALELGE